MYWPQQSWFFFNFWAENLRLKSHSKNLESRQLSALRLRMIWNRQLDLMVWPLILARPQRLCDRYPLNVRMQVQFDWAGNCSIGFLQLLWCYQLVWNKLLLWNVRESVKYRLRLVSALSYVQIQFVNKRWERSRLELLHGWFWKFDPLLDKFNRNSLIFWCKIIFFPWLKTYFPRSAKHCYGLVIKTTPLYRSVSTLWSLWFLSSLQRGIYNNLTEPVYIWIVILMHCSVSCSNWDFRSIQLLTIKWYH